MRSERIVFCSVIKKEYSERVQCEYFETKENNSMELRDITPIPSVPSALIYPKKSRWKPVVLIILIIAVVCTAFWYALPRMLSLFFSGDEQKIENSELLLRKVTVPDRDNGYMHVAKITDESIYLPESNKNFDIDYTNYEKPVAWNQSLVDSVLQRNAQPLAAFSEAASENYFQFPAYADPANLKTDMELYPFNALRRLTRLQAIKALSLARQGKANEALAEAAKLTTFGHHLIVGHNSLIGNLAGIATQRLGSETILQILHVSSPGKGALLNALKKVDEASNVTDGYKDALRFEYTHILNSIDQSINEKLQEQVDAMAREGALIQPVAKYAKHGYYYKPNQTKDLYTALYAWQIGYIGEQCVVGSEPELEKQHTVGWKLVFTENAVGKLLFSATGLLLGSVIAKQCQNDLALNVAKAQLGLLLYKVDHGVAPASLDKIVPDYMSSLPVDPYNNQPLRYNAKEKLLYSVGEKKQDVGGSVGDSWATMENPSFRFTF